MFSRFMNLCLGVGMVVLKPMFEARLAEFESQLCHGLAERPWESYSLWDSVSSSVK